MLLLKIINFITVCPLKVYGSVYNQNAIRMVWKKKPPSGFERDVQIVP